MNPKAKNIIVPVLIFIPLVFIAYAIHSVINSKTIKYPHTVPLVRVESESDRCCLYRHCLVPCGIDMQCTSICCIPDSCPK